MVVVSAGGQTGEVPSFGDRLGDRLVVAQPSGALLEFLVFNPSLSSAPFFEPSVKGRLKRLSNFRHAAYARASRLQRDPIRGNRLTLVSAYAPGRRLADMMVLARRAKVQPRIGGVLSITRQLMTGAALLHDYAPDVFHGGIGPERLVLGSDGRLVITEYVLGTAIEQAATDWGAQRLWRDYRLPALADTTIGRFGRRLDLLQIGVVTLSLLVGRPLADGDFPGRLPDLLDAAREMTAEGESAPLGEPLRDWVSKLLCIEPGSAFRTLIEAQKAFGRMVEEDARYAASQEAVQEFFQQCEDAGPLPVVAPQVQSGRTAAVTESGTVVAAHTPAPEAAPEAPVVEQASGSASEGKLELRSTPVEVPVAELPSAPEVCRTPDPEVPAAEPAMLELRPAPAGEPVRPAPPEEPDGSGLADLLAALPAPAGGADATADPFGPWPVVAGPEAAATLFEEFKVPDAVRESPVVPIPSEEEHPRADSASSSATFEAPTAAPASAPSPQLEVVSNSWITMAASVEPVGHATDAAAAAAENPPAPPAVPAEQPRAAEHATGTRRAAVLSYDQVHSKRAKSSAKTPVLLAAAVIVVLAVAGFVGGPRIGALFNRPAKTPPTAAQPAGPTAPGGFKITTQPAGSRITIDGTPRGKAPLRIDDLAPGLHSIVVESEWGTLEEAVTVESGKVTPLALATVGWIKVEAPVELEVSEEGRSYGRTTGQLMVPAGRHSFVFLNQSVAVRHRQFVQVPAGQVVKVPLDLPQGMLNLTSDQAAQVLLDGEAIGDAPQVSVPASLGPHEVIFRSARYGDVSYSVNVTLAAPVTLRASFTAKR